MKKTCFLLLTVLLTTAALRASAQNKDTSKENFPSTETTLSQIGQAEAHPNARHVRMADTSALAAPVKRPGLIRRIIDYYSRSNVDRTFEKKIDWSIAPGPNYSSDVGFGIGFLLAGLYRLPPPPGPRPAGCRSAPAASRANSGYPRTGAKDLAAWFRRSGKRG